MNLDLTIPEHLVLHMKQRAFQRAPYTGHGTPADRATIVYCQHDHVSGARLIFTRDAGMHTSGWWKNPDYERCLHLSLSFRDPSTGAPVRYHSKKSAKLWCDLFFDGMQRLIWAEPPFSDTGKDHAVWHYRVFMAADWKTPLLPRGEVYSREFTEAGWKSWSDLHGQKQEEAHT